MKTYFQTHTLETPAKIEKCQSARIRDGFRGETLPKDIAVILIDSRGFSADEMTDLNMTGSQAVKQFLTP